MALQGHRTDLVTFTEKILNEKLFSAVKSLENGYPSFSDKVSSTERISLIENDKIINNDSDRSSRPEVFCKKGVLKNLAKFTGKHLFWCLFSIKFQA